ncbi:MAG TPA: tetraacyldisaccharide 4'-kinase [Aeromonadales bacterium]|nr:tetraacyldisaccharide 4'-kinase [Aeromonadales bacterium]
MSKLEKIITQAWYQNKKWILIFYPLELFFSLAQKIRRFFYNTGLFKSYRADVPVIVVGNILVGGTGKTPLVMELVSVLKSAGYSPGIITRGYGGECKKYPLVVNKQSTAREVGDEAILLYRNTQAPVVVDSNRKRSANKATQLGCDVIVSDDGLQHLSLKRDIEIVVFDGQRKLGNEHLLPVGPLRENTNRLNSVDFIFINGKQNISLLQQWKFKSFRLDIKPVTLVDISSKKERGIHSLKNKKIHALVAIGNPLRFIQTLKFLGADVLPHVFDDHYFFTINDIPKDKLPVIVTEKDAVKIEVLPLTGIEYLKISAQLPEAFKIQLLKRLSHLISFNKNRLEK